MLVLSRRVNEVLVLTTEAGERIELEVLQVAGGKVRVGIAAPQSVKVLRGELEQKDRGEAA